MNRHFDPLPFGPGSGGGRAPAPAHVLSARYARGEISRDEFLRAVDDLRAPGAAPADQPTAERPPG